ncbi:MAG: YfcE family phosphodiesterase [Anaerovoracaceae bacterium]|jgi:putative phosphoesterase
MRLLVISDTHGKIEALDEIKNNLFGIDRIIHLGDYEKDGLKFAQHLGIPVISVKGNMDGSYSNNDYRILHTGFGKIYLCHGHMEAVKFGPENLLYKASSLGCKAALYGHTHVPVYEEIGGMYLLNPGSLALPRGGRPGSYAIITIEKDKFDATILYRDTSADNRPSFPAFADKKKGSSGALRRIFNDSDGQ